MEHDMNKIMTLKWGVALSAMLWFAACQPDSVQTPTDGEVAASDERFEDNSESPELAPDAYQTARRPYTAWGGEVELYFTRPGTQRGEEEDPEADDAIADAIHNAQTSVDLCLYEFNRPNIVEAVVEDVRHRDNPRTLRSRAPLVRRCRPSRGGARPGP